MTRVDAGVAADRVALFASGAPFSVYVLQCLRQSGLAPALIAVPGYPPAPAPASDVIVSVGAESEFARLARDIPQLNAPPGLQGACAERIRAEAIDYILVACWPYLIAPELTASPRKAALNLHPSPLPRYRGPDPVAQQLARRETRLGVTLHRLNQRFDAGAIVAQQCFDAGTLGQDRIAVEKTCARLGVDLFLDAMRRYDEGWSERPQSA